MKGQFQPFRCRSCGSSSIEAVASVYTYEPVLSVDFDSSPLKYDGDPIEVGTDIEDVYYRCKTCFNESENLSDLVEPIT